MVPNWSSAYKLAQTAAVARVDGDGETRIALGEEPALRGELSCGGDVVGQLAVSDRSLTSLRGSAPYHFVFAPIVVLSSSGLPSTSRMRAYASGRNPRHPPTRPGHQSARAPNSTIRNLAAEVPSPLVAELLGHGYQGASRHAEIPAKSWLKYANS